MKKRSIILMAVLLFIPLLSACGTRNFDFVIMAGSDNGFTAASREYIGIEGTNVVKITKRQYENLTLGNTSPYVHADQKTYTYDADASGNDPSTWVYRENDANPDDYDDQQLIDDLKTMGVSYTGDVYLCITTFADYRIIEAVNTVNNVVTGEAYAVFKGNMMLKIPKGIELNDIRKVYVKI